jgi:SAM-dependent methyltransferase
MSTKSQYDGFAVDYHWLYSDNALTGKPALDQNDDVLRDAAPKSRILDCTCGIGGFAIALSKLGYEVSGSDGSPGMVEQANLAVRNAGVDVPLKCCTWEELPAHFTDPFDMVFCLGNAIGHSRNGEEMLRSVKGMRAVVRSGGKLVIDSRNWDKLTTEKTGFTHYDWRERAGQRCLPIYVWNFPEKFEDAHTIDVLLVFDSGDKASIRSYPIVYYPFHVEELIENLKGAGFSNIQNRLSANGMDYRVIAT